MEVAYNRIPILEYPKHRVHGPISRTGNRHHYRPVLIKTTRAISAHPQADHESVNPGNVTKET
jgi:hypothetical protein